MLSKAAVVHEKGGKYVIEDIEIAPPKEDEVLIKVHGCGLCHTDELGRSQDIPVPLPAVLGHEGSGEVVEVGSKVTSVKPGDHVVLSFTYCGTCETCLTGMPNICYNNPKLNFGGFMSDGTARLSIKGKTCTISLASPPLLTMPWPMKKTWCPWTRTWI